MLRAVCAFSNSHLNFSTKNLDDRHVWPKDSIKAGRSLCPKEVSLYLNALPKYESKLLI